MRPKLTMRCAVCRKEFTTKSERRVTCGGECSQAHGDTMRAQYDRRWDESKLISGFIRQLILDDVREYATPTVEAETSKRTRMPDMIVTGATTAKDAKSIMGAVENALAPGLKLGLTYNSTLAWLPCRL